MARPRPPWQAATVRIDDDFHGGSIEVLAVHGHAARLIIPADTAADFRQWFCFRVRGAAGEACRFTLENAGETTYPDAWEGYRACRSTALDDEEGWVRVPTRYSEGRLTIEDTPPTDEVFYAYFAPYPDSRHERLIARCAASDRARVEVLGATVDGRDLTLIVFGDEADEDRAQVWITARQHPGETMAEWFVEGVVDRLLGDDEDDPALADLRARATIYLVPCLCPDGAARGHLRSNAAGENLNRCWRDPSADDSPEVALVRARLEQTGVDVFLDVHGDERTPYCFACGCEGNPSYDERIDALEDLFMDSLMTFDPNFQRAYGYENDPPGEGDLSTASNWVGERFGALSLTIEMPFKDNADDPDAARGWSPTRAKRLGWQCLSSVAVCLDGARRRDEG